MLLREMDLKVDELTISGAAKCPKARLRKTEAESFGWVWVLSQVRKGVQALKLLDLAASVPGHEGTNQRGESRP
jgi:hypothetical protein